MKSPIFSLATTLIIYATCSSKSLRAEIDPLSLLNSGKLKSYLAESYDACPKLGAYLKQKGDAATKNITSISAQAPFSQFYYTRFIENKKRNNTNGLTITASLQSDSQNLMISACQITPTPMGIYFNFYANYQKICGSGKCLTFAQALKKAQNSAQTGGTQVEVTEVQIYQPLVPRSKPMYQFTVKYPNGRSKEIRISVDGNVLN